MDEKLPTFIHAGAQRSGSTWIYHALKEHPDIFMPNYEPINFFDCQYHQGLSWYQNIFKDHNEEKAIGDESPGYIKNPLAPKRIADTIPDVKIIFCLRNPIGRAYSQWWRAEHNFMNTEFKRCLYHHSLNSLFIVPGYYNYHLSRWEKYFDDDQIKITFFDDFISDNEAFIQNIYGFIGVDDKYSPSIINKRVQASKTKAGPNDFLKVIQPLIKTGEKIGKNTPSPLREKILRPLYEKIYEFSPGGKSYKEGMEDETRKELEKIYYDDIKKLEKRTNRNLDHWFEHIN